MQPPRVKTATDLDRAALVDTIVLAFAADPVARWCWPESHRYLAAMPAFTLAFGGAAFPHESAHCTEDHAAGALWLPPGAHPDEPSLGRIIEATVRDGTRRELSAVLEQMAAYHPREPHWYLPLIGVDPAHQGQGLGGALLAHALARCDQDRSLAYLESTNPRNITLYQRHGFRALGRIQVGASPTLVPMVREPR